MQAFRNHTSLYAFIYMFYAGFFLNALYSLKFSLFHNSHMIFRIAADLFLAALTAFVLFLAILLSGSNALRCFMTVAFLLGAALQKYSLSVIIKKLSSYKRKTGNSGE
ncbi:MAG: hypothetical protein II343_03320 [Clostridia bacterium]|nr:hypothetical protein [Clostridia bacterium]